MEPVPSVERGFFPLDEELALLPGTLAPGVQEHLTHLATWMPFRRAAQMLTRLVGVQLSEATIRRQTEAVGAIAESLHTQASAQPASNVPSTCDPGPASRLVFSADGAYVGLLHGVWAEVRTLVIAEVGPHGRAHHLSYFSRKTEAERFAEVAEVETRRRGLVQAHQVCAVTDGAEWLQGLIDLHRPDAVRILDFAHAAQRFGQIAQAHEAAKQPLPDDWVSTQCHTLKHQGPAEVLERLHALPVVQDAMEHVQYLEKREALMQYPSYQADGWPIGSGIVESGNKVVMQARLKGAGMRWEDRHVNSMLALRTSVCNDRWDETWQQVSHERLQRRKHRRVQRASPRLAAVLSVIVRAWRQAHSPAHPIATICLSRPSEPAATLPGSSRPSASHPWKRTLACRPKLSAK